MRGPELGGAGLPGAVGGRLARVAPFIHVLLGTTLVFGDSEPTVQVLLRRGGPWWWWGA